MIQEKVYGPTAAQLQANIGGYPQTATSYSLPHGLQDQRQIASNEVINFANRLNSQADEVSSSVAQKLARYSTKAAETNQASVPPLPNMPEYFDLLRGHLMQIENALNSITASLERAEL